LLPPPPPPPTGSALTYILIQAMAEVFFQAFCGYHLCFLFLFCYACYLKIAEVIF